MATSFKELNKAGRVLDIVGEYCYKVAFQNIDKTCHYVTINGKQNA